MNTEYVLLIFLLFSSRLEYKLRSFFSSKRIQSSSFVVFRLLNYHARKYRASSILCKYRYVINREILNEIYARKWGEGEAYKRRVN